MAATSEVHAGTVAAEEPSSAVFNGSINEADDSDYSPASDAKKDEDVEME